jgi:hypothetical protein
MAIRATPINLISRITQTSHQKIIPMVGLRQPCRAIRRPIRRAKGTRQTLAAIHLGRTTTAAATTTLVVAAIMPAAAATEEGRRGISRTGRTAFA